MNDKNKCPHCGNEKYVDDRECGPCYAAFFGAGCPATTTGSECEDYDQYGNRW